MISTLGVDDDAAIVYVINGWAFPRKRPAEQRRAPRPTRALRGLRASGVTIGG